MLRCRKQQKMVSLSSTYLVLSEMTRTMKCNYEPFHANAFVQLRQRGFDNNLPLSSAERYDAELDRWVGVRPMSTSRGGVGVASLAGRLYAVGGHNGSKYLDSVEAYDPVLDRWEPVANIHGGRAGPGTAHCNCSTLALPALNHYDSSCDDEESAN
ncbi:hypothetical protein HPB51_002377 [Rhipicephalus microplus]|uniref:Uncharacterized protein n=1 Tax=Rhipicephalus microplus TaxID=6941 RepID=A0A9J6DS69_RHIMP|nr:hypothetical protein HPB51_002377 [Rhipicephalus microplus]